MPLPNDCRECKCPEIKLVRQEIEHIVTEIQKCAVTLKELNEKAQEQIITFSLAMQKQESRLSAGSDIFEKLTKNQEDIQKALKIIELERAEKEGEEKLGKRLGIIGTGTGVPAILYIIWNWIKTFPNSGQ